MKTKKILSRLGIPLILVLATGCSSAQLKADEAAAAADLHTVGIMLVGAGTAAKAHPELLQVGTAIAKAALAKAGVPQATTVMLTQAVSEKNADKLVQGGQDLQALGSGLNNLAATPGQ